MIKETVKTQKYLSEFLLLLVTLIWGATFSIIKESLNDASPMLFVGVRFFIAAFLMALFFRNKIKGIDKDTLKHGFIMGLFLFGGFAFQTLGLKYTTATKSGFITGSLVVLIPLFHFLIRRKPPSLGSFIGIVLVFTGILFLSSSGDSISSFIFEFGDTLNYGDLLTFFCANCFALYVVFIDKYSPRHNYWSLTFIQICTTAAGGLLFTVLFHVSSLENFYIDLTGNLLFGLLYTSIFATIVATVLQTKYQRNISPAKAGIIFSFEPIFSAIIAFIFLDEIISKLGYIGSVFVFSGLVISEIYDFWVKKWKTN